MLAQVSKCYVQKSPIAGKGLFASEAIPAGEQIFAIPRPLVGVLDYPRLADCCSNCFYFTAASSNFGPYGDEPREVKACSQCKLLKFCGKNCQAQAWKRFHKFECKFFSKIGANRPWPNAVRAAIQIMNMRTNGVLPDEEWLALQKMSSHLDAIRQTKGKQWADFEIISRAILELSSAKVALTINDAKEVYARILSNSLTLITSTFDPIGLVVDPLLGSANHSCDLNAYAVMDGPKMSFRTLKTIAKDEEIFISYIDSCYPTNIRQSQLRDRFFFDCKCNKCHRHANESGSTDSIPEAERFLGKPTELAPKWKAFLDAGYKKSYPDFAKGFFKELPQNRTASSSEPYSDAKFAERFSSEVANDIANEGIVDIDFNESVNDLEFLLKLLATSKRFAVSRQPYASIRQEYITKLCYVAKWRQAFVQSAKQYFHIDPVLYPETHHPLRVMHNANLAMLVLAIGTDPEFWGKPAPLGDPIGDINYGVLIYFLLMEVVANVDRSHGKESKFSKVVKQKFEDIKADTPREGLREFEGHREETWRQFRRIADRPDPTF